MFLPCAYYYFIFLLPRKMERKGEHRGTAAPFSAHMQSLQCGMHAVLSLPVSRTMPSHCTGAPSRATRLAHWHPLHRTFLLPAPCFASSCAAQHTLAAVLANKQPSFHCVAGGLAILICCTVQGSTFSQGPSMPLHGGGRRRR